MYQSPPLRVSGPTGYQPNRYRSFAMTVTTRPATAADTAFARTVHHAAYRDVVIRQFGPWDEAVQDRFFEGDWNGAQFDIILVDGKPCGYTAVEERPDDIHIRELVIHPDHQGKGVGSAFLHRIMQEAASRGVPIRLGTFLQNEGSIALYERLGFRRVGKTDIHTLMEWSDKRVAGGF